LTTVVTNRLQTKRSLILEALGASDGQKALVAAVFSTGKAVGK